MANNVKYLIDMFDGNFPATVAGLAVLGAVFFRRGG
jgi:hypothetical protein